MKSEKNELEALPNLDICFDWVQVTFHTLDYKKIIEDIFGVSVNSCTHTNSGRFGYNETYTVFSKCHVMINQKMSSMGVHILLSGSACREFEQCLDWGSFFRYCIEHNARFTRIDIAIDCYKRYFTVKQLKNKIKKGELTSKFKKSTYITEYNLKDGSSNSASLKFGSMSSDIYIVIYDKLAERMNAGYTVKSGISFWTRCELRFKKDLSNSIAELYLNNQFELSNFVFKVLYNYLDFKDSGSDSNRSRWETSKFWLDFINDANKLQISKKAFQSTIQSKMEYAEGYLYKLFTMLQFVDNEFMDNMIKKGKEHITKHDLDIINSFLISQNMKPVTFMDIENFNNKYEQIALFKAIG